MCLLCAHVPKEAIASTARVALPKEPSTGMCHVPGGGGGGGGRIEPVAMDFGVLADDPVGPALALRRGNSTSVLTVHYYLPAFLNPKLEESVLTLRSLLCDLERQQEES